MSKVKLDSGIRSQFTMAARIVRELSKFTPSQRERIMAVVVEHGFEAAPYAGDDGETQADAL